MESAQSSLDRLGSKVYDWAGSPQFINEKNIMASYKKGVSGNPAGRAPGTKCAKTLLKDAIAVVSSAMSDVSLPIGLRVTAAVAVIEAQTLKTRTHAPSDTDNG